MEHNHSGNTINKGKHNKIKTAFFLTLFFALVEFATGTIFNSLALIADSIHMATDTIALFIASIAIYLSSKPATKKFTFGLGKIEVAAAIINVLLIFYVVFGIGYEAYMRIGSDIDINASGVILVSSIGFFVNVIVFLMLHYGYENLNTKAAKLHVIGDLLGSVAAIISGIIILTTGWVIFDPIMSFIVCAILIKMSLGLIKNIIYSLMDAVPENINIKEIESLIIDTDEKIKSIHDLHIWKSADKEISLTAHIDLTDLNDWNETILKINERLKKKGILHVTIQPEKL